MLRCLGGTSHTSVVDPFGLQCSISWWVFCFFFFSTHRWEWDSKVSSHYCWIVFFLPSILSVFVECVLATLLLWAHMCIVTLASSWMWLFLLQKLFISSNNFCFHVYFLWYFSSLMVTVCMVISSFYLFASNLLISLN